MDNQIPPSPANFVVQSQPLNTATENIEQKIEIPEGVKIVSIVFFILGFLYLGSTAVFFFVNIILNRIASFGSGFEFEFLRYFPTVGVIPILLSIATLIYFFLAIKIRDCSKSSWIMGIISLIVLPIPLGVITHWLMSPLATIGGGATSEAAQNQINLKPFQPITSISVLSDLIVFGLIILSFLILIIKHKMFANEVRPISTKARIFLGIVALVVVVPVVTYMTFGLYKNTDKDKGFTEAQKYTSFHIYRPSYVPSDFVQWNKPKPVKDVTGGMSAVTVVYGPPLNNAAEPGVLAITQEQINSTFNLSNFVSSQVKDPKKEQVKTITVPQAVGGKAYLHQVTDKSYYFYYIDGNNILFRILFGVIGQDEAMKVIDSFQ